MRKLLLSLAILLGLCGAASAQCNGIFPANTVCGSLTPGPPSQVPFTSFPGGGGGGGTVMGALAGQIAWYAATGSTVVGINPVCTPINGLVGDGVTDNTAALNTALAALPTGGGCLAFSAGIFKFNSTITKTFPNASYSLTIIGTGADSTTLLWGGNGLIINYVNQVQSFHLRNLTFASSIATGANTALQLIQTGTVINGVNPPPNDLIQVTFRGSDGYTVTNFWGAAIQSAGISNLNLDTVFITGPAGVSGTGLSFAGLPAQAFYAVVLNISKSVFANMTNCIVYGNYVQGVTVSRTNFGGCQNGINVAGGTTGSLDQLTVTGSQFGQFTGGNSIILSTLVEDVLIQSNLFILSSLGAPNNSIDMAASGNYVISGNSFLGGGAVNQYGVIIGTQAANSGGVISGNKFAAEFVGVFLQGPSARTTVSGNSYSSNTTNTTDLGTANVILDDPTGLVGTFIMGASPFTYTAGAHPEIHYVNQGATNTAFVTQGGNQIAVLNTPQSYYTIVLNPHESYTTTWTTTAPGYVKNVH